MRKQRLNAAWLGVLSLLLIGGIVYGDTTILDENFDGLSLDPSWASYDGGGKMSLSVGGGALSIQSQSAQGTSVGGIWLKAPVSSEGTIDLYFKMNINVSTGTLLPNVGLTTSLPVNADMPSTGASSYGWGLYTWSQTSGSLTAASGGAARVRLKEANQTAFNSWDYNWGYKAGWDFKNTGDAWVHLHLDESANLFSLQQSSDGVTWRDLGESRTLTEQEQSLLETGEYYVLFRLVSSSATATVQIDRIWATTVPEPTTIGLICVGLSGILFRRKK